MIIQRPSRDSYCMDIAHVVAKRSTCPRLAVGAVLVSPDFHIISTGYNGAPRRTEHCGCVIDEAGHCARAVHAEANAVAQAAFQGQPTANARMYVTHYPCVRCVSLLINAGVTAIVYNEKYRLDSEVDRIANESFLTIWGTADEL